MKQMGIDRYITDANRALDKILPSLEMAEYDMAELKSLTTTFNEYAASLIDKSFGMMEMKELTEMFLSCRKANEEFTKSFNKDLVDTVLADCAVKVQSLSNHMKFNDIHDEDALDVVHRFSELAKIAVSKSDRIRTQMLEMKNTEARLLSQVNQHKIVKNLKLEKPADASKQPDWMKDLLKK